MNSHASSMGNARFVVAHRAANDLESMRDAHARGVHMVEADVHRFRGRLEIRHLKTIGPIPILWDRWTLANPFSRRMELHELLRALPVDVDLMLDLKGRSMLVAKAVLEAIRPTLADGRDVVICARAWKLLGAFDGVSGVRSVHSVGSERQLQRLIRVRAGRKVDGVAIHERLLRAHTIREVHAIADLVMTWPVNSIDRARELLAHGVQGLISDNPAAAVTWMEEAG